MNKYDHNIRCSFYVYCMQITHKLRDELYLNFRLRIQGGLCQCILTICDAEIRSWWIYWWLDFSVWAQKMSPFQCTKQTFVVLASLVFRMFYRLCLKCKHFERGNLLCNKCSTWVQYCALQLLAKEHEMYTAEVCLSFKGFCSLTWPLCTYVRRISLVMWNRTSCSLVTRIEAL